MEEFFKYLSVYAVSGLKFVFGPALGTSYGFSLMTTALLTAFGMMTSVYLFTYLGDKLKRLVDRIRSKNRKLFSKKNRRFVKIWRRHGVKGIAFLSPIILMPIGGAILANVLGGKKNEIIYWMWVSSLFWAFLITAGIKYGWEAVNNLFLD